MDKWQQQQRCFQSPRNKLHFASRDEGAWCTPSKTQPSLFSLPLALSHTHLLCPRLLLELLDYRALVDLEVLVKTSSSLQQRRGHGLRFKYKCDFPTLGLACTGPGDRSWWSVRATRYRGGCGQCVRYKNAGTMFRSVPRSSHMLRPVHVLIVTFRVQTPRRSSLALRCCHPLILGGFRSPIFCRW